MMRRLIITDSARSDLLDIRRYTLGRYGETKAKAYDLLIKQALRDLRDDPNRPGSRDRPEIGESIRSYHTALARGRSGSGVKSPRHFVLYFISAADDVVISRILHDSRDLGRHVPRDHLDESRAVIGEQNDPDRKQKC